MQREVNLLLAIEEKRWNFRRQRNDQEKRRTEPKLLRGGVKRQKDNGGREAGVWEAGGV